MDWLKTGGISKAFLKKYAPVGAILLVGIVLMCLPGGGREKEVSPTEEVTEPVSQPTVEQALEEILSQIRGAGQVRLLLTVAKGEDTLYQTDTTGAGETLRVETVLITDGDRAQRGLVRQVNPQIYLGAVVVCQGGDVPAVRLALTQAVAAATGLTTDKITVLKMK